LALVQGLLGDVGCVLAGSGDRGKGEDCDRHHHRERPGDHGHPTETMPVHCAPCQFPPWMLCSQSATTFAISSRTVPSVRPPRLGTRKLWSAPSMVWSVARGSLSSTPA